MKGQTKVYLEVQRNRFSHCQNTNGGIALEYREGREVMVESALLHFFDWFAYAHHKPFFLG